MSTIDKKDIQGFLLKGYGRMRATKYYLLKVGNARAGKEWLDKISGHITDAAQSPDHTCVNVAFTSHGLLALGLAPDNLKYFSREFIEGLDTSHRNRILGDEGASGPENWEFGSNAVNARDTRLADVNIHMMAMLFAKNEEVLSGLCAEYEASFAAHQLEVLVPLEGRLLEENKIHLGFSDGISQPGVVGVSQNIHPNNMVATGEFLMGYLNEYGVYPDSPTVNTPQGDLNLLPLDPNGSGRKDLGFNGSYLVYRKVEEKVDRFWKFANEHTRTENGDLNAEESIRLASKMVGRWPNGAPLAKYPDRMPEGLSKDDNFGYHAEDQAGLRCPFGSHMRRNNPRDAFEDNSAELSLKLTKKHRIIRRGRSYGEPLVATPANHTAKGEIGLHFMCFNADIAGQFEFIQHTWANFPRFQNLYNDPDPITGVRDVPMPGEALIQNFTVQAEPVKKTYPDLKQFVITKGGAYFFFPSITVLKYLTTI